MTFCPSLTFTQLGSVPSLTFYTHLSHPAHFPHEQVRMRHVSLPPPSLSLATCIYQISAFRFGLAASFRTADCQEYANLRQCHMEPPETGARASFRSLLIWQTSCPVSTSTKVLRTLLQERLATRSFLFVLPCRLLLKGTVQRDLTH
jgi:hypothetical protein